jgi:hypothetical protein
MSHVVSIPGASLKSCTSFLGQSIFLYKTKKLAKEFGEAPVPRWMCFNIIVETTQLHGACIPNALKKKKEIEKKLLS